MILTTTSKSFTESHVVSNKHFKTININALKSFMGFQRKESAENAEHITNPVCDFGTTFKEVQQLLLLSIQMFFSDKQQCRLHQTHR